MALFNLIVGFNYSNLSSIAKKFIDKLSKLTRGCYLKIVVA